MPQPDSFQNDAIPNFVKDALTYFLKQDIQAKAFYCRLGNKKNRSNNSNEEKFALQVLVAQTLPWPGRKQICSGLFFQNQLSCLW